MIKNILRILSVLFISKLLKPKEEEIHPPPPPFPKHKFDELEIDTKIGKEKLIELKPKNNKKDIPIKKLTPKKEIEKPFQAKNIISKKKEDKIYTPEFKIPDFKANDSLMLSKIEEKKVKPKEIEKAEKEIQRAIEGIKNYKEKKQMFKRFFKPKEIEKFPDVFIPRTYEKSNDINDILDLIHNARKALMDFNLDEAKKIYIEIMRKYTDSSIEKRKRVYKDIKDLYEERKNAESLNLK